jgi:adenylosuccinate lyase
MSHAASSSYDTYTSPLATRNASEEMLRLWSARHKFNTWRRIWLAVAEAQHEMGLPVTKEQVEELRAVVNRPGGITDDEIRLAEKYERELRHDVMAHVHALGDSCPKAKGIIHLGMTSQDVVCNADLHVIHECMSLIDSKLIRLICSLGTTGKDHAHVATLGFTHYQPAQPLTVGRRLVQCAYELTLLRRRFDGWVYQCSGGLVLRGLRGATGSQASFLALAGGSSGIVDQVEAAFISKFHPHAFWSSEELGTPEQQLQKAIARIEKSVADIKSKDLQPKHLRQYERRLAELQSMTAIEYAAKDARSRIDEMAFWITGQTYPRVIDTFILADLASVAAVLHKIATDIRLLCNRKEVDEPFEGKQIGSSAMPYKRNPMRCERICGLSRFVMNLVGNAYDTAATQWLERTLDDSSNRRLSLPEAFLALDGALDLMHNVASGLIVHEAMVKKNLMAELPFMATENILMECVKLGGDRQHYHELIRQHAQAAGLRVKQEGLDNDLLDRLKNDQNFWSTKRGGPLSAELNWDGVMDPMKYVGRSVEQTERFIKEVVEPLREQYKDAIAKLGTSGPKV